MRKFFLYGSCIKKLFDLLPNTYFFIKLYFLSKNILRVFGFATFGYTKIEILIFYVLLFYVISSGSALLLLYRYDNISSIYVNISKNNTAVNWFNPSTIASSVSLIGSAGSIKGNKHRINRQFIINFSQRDHFLQIELSHSGMIRLKKLSIQRL